MAPWRDKGGLIAKALNFKPDSSLGLKMSLFTVETQGGKQIKMRGI